MRSLSNNLLNGTVTLMLCACQAVHSSDGQKTAEYSLAINHGRVIDPETGLDAIRHLGIRDNAIVEISTTPLAGTETIDASKLIVSPGFIDLHTHSPTELGQYYQAFDGVTTALELEAGAFPVTAYAQQISDAPLMNFGASVGYLSIRLLIKDGIAASGPGADPKPANLKGWITAAKVLFGDFNSALKRTFTEPASAEEIELLRAQLNKGLDQGGLGIGLALDYISEAVGADELAMIFDVAAARKAPLFIHIRRGINGDPAGLMEVLALAEASGAPLHICHISHNAMKNLDLFLREIQAARERGVDVTTEVLPYNAGSTNISAAVFGRDWQTIFGITYEDVEWAATGERLTQETFTQYRKKEPEGTVIHHYLDEAWTLRAIQEPNVMVVSDLITMKSRDAHVAPHNGAFTRVLGRYVRDQGALSWMEALGKMTLLPAQRLEEYVPAFRNKGRVQLNMDADLTLFDPATVLDRATYRDPYQESAGIQYVVVNGKVVIREGELVPGIHSGKRQLALPAR